LDSRAISTPKHNTIWTLDLYKLLNIIKYGFQLLNIIQYGLQTSICSKCSTPQGFLKPVSIQVQLVSYQCPHGHKLLIDQYQTNGHDLSSYISTRTSYQCQQGHKLSTINGKQWARSRKLSISIRNS